MRIPNPCAPQDFQHPLLSERLGRRLVSANLDPEARVTFIERVGEIIEAHDSALNAVESRLAVAMDERRAASSARLRVLHEEYEALYRMVVADYDTILGPLAQYGDKITAERDVVLRELQNTWNTAVEEQRRAYADANAAMGTELRKFQAALFKQGKDALNEALEHARRATLKRHLNNEHSSLNH
jgi:hypothetical protein